MTRKRSPSPDMVIVAMGSDQTIEVIDSFFMEIGNVDLLGQIESEIPAGINHNVYVTGADQNRIPLPDVDEGNLLADHFRARNALKKDGAHQKRGKFANRRII